MNANTFRLIFSKHLGMCVPVAEQSCAQGKQASKKVAQLVLKPLALAWLSSLPAFALPVAPVVVNGSASFSQSGNTLTVTNTPNAILNWSSFSIGQNEMTRFVQQGSASAVLNRVTGQNPSQILGQLQSNGRVFLINPNGIVFGQGARIDTAGLVASTLSLSDADFLAGKLRLTGTGSEGKAENQGTIATADGGFVYLIAPNVENSGVIHAPNGDVLLAAGQSVEIADSLNPALRVVLTAPEGRVVNLGQVLAESGRIGLHAGLVSNSGTVSASSAVAEGGKIYLRATEKIELSETSNLMADGTTGGEIAAIVAKGGQISGELLARGNISAQGGGGFIETSAAKLDISNIQVGATGGLWLIDPTDITINATDCAGTNCVAADMISSTLNAGTSVSISTDATTGSDAGNINVNASVSWNTSSLSLNASNDININAVMTATGTASLDLNTGTSGAIKVGFNPDGSFKGRVDFGGRSGSNWLTINDFSYNLINTAADLQGITNLAGQYALGSHIDASATSNFVPIGNNTSPFTGSFEGLGHTINNLSINQPAQEYLGLFGTIGTNGSVRNVGLTNISYTVGWGNVGGLAGSNMGAISNSYATGAITSGAEAYNTGGLVGYNGGTIQGSHAAVNITAGDYSDSIGGLVGIAVGGGNFSSAISNSYASGNVSVGANSNNIGGLLGAADAASISTSYATGAVSAGNTSQSIGGLVGLADSSSSIDKSHASGAVTGNGDGNRLGGLVGELGPYSTVANSYATGAVTAGDGGSTLGGLVGYNNSYNGGSISTSYASGAVSSGNNSDQIGGLVGDHNGSLIQNSYATGSVTTGTSSDGIGGLVGYQTSVSAIQYSYATGKVTTGAGTTRAGGLVGAGCSVTSTCDITSSYWDVDTTGRIDGIGSYPSNLGVSGIYSATTTVNAYNQATYTGFDFSSRSPAWWMSEGNTRPFLRMEWGNTITNAHQLQLMAMNLSANYTLANNLDLAPALNAVNGLYPGMWGSKGFVPVGSSTASFTGSFDGLGHTVSGLFIDRPSTDNVGLIGYTGVGAAIRNLGLEGGSITGYSNVGGLVGVNLSGTVNSTYSTAGVSGYDWVGGLIGRNLNGSVSNNYATGSVAGHFWLGGLVGYNTGTVSNSYALGSVTGGSSIGGLVGYNSGTVSSTYAAGHVVGGGSNVGGLLGEYYGFVGVSNSYWNTTVNGSLPGIGMPVYGQTLTNVTGLTESQMKDAANFGGFNFSTVWNIDTGSTVSYPYLRNPEQIPHPGLSRSATTCSVCTWDGGGGSNALWSLASNWTGDLLPAPASSVTIGGGFGTVLYDINSLSLTSLSASSALDIQSGKTLTLTGNGVFNAPLSGSGTLDIAGALVNAGANAINIARLNLSGGSLSGTGNLTVSNNFNWTGGALGSTFHNLSLTKQGNFSIGDIAADGNITLNAQGGNLTLTGNVSRIGGSAATLTMNADGTLVINSGVDVDIGTGALATSIGTGAFNNAGTVSVGADSSMSAALNNTGVFKLTNGTLSLLAGANNSGTFNLTGTGSIRLPRSGNAYPTFANAAGGVLNINSNSGGWSFVSDSGTQGGIVTNAGTININTSYTSWEAAFTNSSTGLLNLADGNALSMQNGQTLQGNIALGAGSTLWVSERHGANAWFNGTTISGTGTVQVSAGVGPVADFTNVNAAAATLLVGNGGTANVLSGNSTFANLNMTGGTLSGDGTLNLNTALTQTGGTQSGSGSTVLGASATSTLGAASLNRTLTNQGTLNLNQTTVSGSLENSGTLNVVGGTSTVAGAFTQSGILDVASGASFVRSGGFSNTGTIRGKGTIEIGATATLDNNGTIRPGASPGTLTINGNYSQGANGTLVMELGGTTQGVSYDWLNVTGTASLGGTLQVDLYGGFVPVAGNSFDLVSALGGVSGTFSQNNLPVGYSFASSYGGNLFNLNLQPTAASASAGTANAILDALLNMAAVSYETPLLYLSGQSSSTASSSGLLIQTAETVLPDLLPDVPFGAPESAAQGTAPFSSLLPLFDELARDAIFKDIFHDSRLICR